MIPSMDRPIYNEEPFGLQEAGRNPFGLFEEWFAAAVAADPNNAAVMNLATAVGDRPSARMVLLKEHGPGGFVFYTNFRSRKGRELEENPLAALTFWWPHAERQVRIEGRIAPIMPEASDAYFANRNRNSQLGAWASAQSSEIDEPVTLEAAHAKFKDEKIPRPKSWGGLRLTPNRFEFWQGRTSRLHDRVVFEQHDAIWLTKRLAP